MRIVCPSCSAAYDIPDSLVTAGRVVRCARCAREWAPVEAAAPPEPPPPPTAVEDSKPPAADVPRMPVVAIARQSAMDRLAAHPPEPQPSGHLRLAWAATVAVLVVAAAVAYTWRGDIVTAWPPSARAYAAFGLHPTTETR